MMYSTFTDMSCGILCIAAIQDRVDDEEIVYQACQQNPYPAMVLFSHNKDGEYHLKTLRAFIEKNALGEVTFSRWKKNPNSNNLIRLATWFVNQAATVTYYKKHNLKRRGYDVRGWD